MIEPVATTARRKLSAGFLRAVARRRAAHDTASFAPERADDRRAWRPVGVPDSRLLRRSPDLRLALMLALALLAGALAYQAPPSADIAVGWAGDRLFLRASEGLSQGDALSFYGDELTPPASSGRSRWTRQGAELVIPGLGPGGLRVTLRAQGWPDDTIGAPVSQPFVTVLANGAQVGRFVPTPAWADYVMDIPAAARAGDDLTLTLQASHVFTSTRAFADPRPKGLRVEALRVRGAGSPGPVLPPLAPLALLALSAALCYPALTRLARRPNLSFVLTVALLTAQAVGLALARSWTVLLLPWVAGATGLLLLLALRRPVGAALLALLRRYGRGDALGVGLAAAGGAWLAIAAARLSATLPLPSFTLFRESFPDSLLYGLLGMSLLMLVLVLGRDGLPRVAQALVGLAASRAGAAALLALFLVVWVGYEAVVIAGMPYVGHADYADNAVVARNLVAGRGWVVDYVSQFYRLYDGVTRPQETWPLLQPLWIAPFFALLGASNWAAKLPNLLFTLALGLAVYAAGARLWDRRVGLTAAVILLTSHLFFKLVIYATSDLAFVVFAFGAIWLLYRATADDRPATRGQWRLAGSAVLTGLMIFQKPGSGGLIALGMGLWLLAQALRAGSGRRLSSIVHRLAPVVEWGVIALLIIAPLIARNLLTFGAPYYSTESHDAWVLEYTKWDEIYAVYTTEGGLSALGVPDRSWVLRWGFDRTLVKIARQFAAVRDYLAPAWPGLPLGLGPALTGRADKDIRLLFDAGAWLALLGALGARRRLLGLLLAAFAPYTLFLTLYWHANEERYFVALMPWLALLAAYALWRGYDRLAAVGDGRWAPLGMAMAAAALALTIQPSWPLIAEKVRGEPQLYAADLDAYAWLREETPVNAVMMTRNPWQLNWHSRRPALMIPYTTDRDTLLRLARHYGARYLVLDSLQRPEPEVQRMLDAMLEDPALGFTEVYRTPVYVAHVGGRRIEVQAEVYAFPADYGGVAPVVSR